MDEEELDDARFAKDFKRHFDEQIRERLKGEPSKRTSPATDAILRSLAVATAKAVGDQSWPSNQPIKLALSADKCTEQMREIVASETDLSEVQVSDCLGTRLDFQARLGDKVLVNAETELHGSRLRADDTKKLLNHDRPPVVSAMIGRGKSEKETERIRRSMKAVSEGRPEMFLSATLHWKKDAGANEATVYLDSNQDD